MDKASKIKVLYGVIADVHNTNAQSQNAREIGLRLSKDDFEVTYFATNPDPKLLLAENVNILMLPSRLSNLSLARHYLRYDYDILIYPPFDRVASIIEKLKWLRKPSKVVYPIEGTLESVKSSWAVKNLLGLIEGADLRVSLSKFIADQFMTVKGLSSVVIPIGVNVEDFGDIDRTNRHGPVKIISISSFTPRKNLHFILKIAQEIPQDRIEFIIIGAPYGDTSYFESMKKRADENGLNNIRFLGHKNRVEVSALLKEADIHVHTSHIEGTPKVILEAAASGLPSVIFDDYEAPSVVQGRTGFQVNNDQDFIESVKRLVDDKELRLFMGQNAFSIIKDFSWEDISLSWEKELKKLFGKTSLLH
ncbi:MAG: glycosyltransferase family 4 protein [Acidimicrobiales bacterium]|nr:glycosyltransferase family 4 protein [Acidimicrobiales bacterium]